MEIVVGTAGHIDHGKTALIKALTGTDADRLPEEKRRGITVDLGFAEMTLGETHVGFVDVPGHERFVKNMLAGASGIDLVLLVIAADEGVMPQTREHFDICRLLGIKSGIVVLTKTDLIDPETLELAKLDAAELVAGSFLEIARVIPVCSRTGDGIEDLKEAIAQNSSSLPARNDQMVARLPIDRSFSVKGFGAVVTGTLASGTIAEGAEMQLLPTGAKVRVRGLQTHGNSVRSAAAGQRVAVNLGGIDYSKVARGMVLAESNALKPTQIVDARIEVLTSSPKPLRSRQRVRVHFGTIETLARVDVLNETGEIAAGGQDMVQIRFELPVVAVPGERLILRRYSPQITIAGGEVIDAQAEKHRKKELGSRRHLLHELLVSADNSSERVRLHVTAAGLKGLDLSGLQLRIGLSKKALSEAVQENIEKNTIVDAAGQYVATAIFAELCAEAESEIKAFHAREPLVKGISREVLRERIAAYIPAEVFQAALAALDAAGKIRSDKETIRFASHKTEFSVDEMRLRERLLAVFAIAALEPPRLEDTLNDIEAGTNISHADVRKHFQQFLDSREIVKVTEEFYFAADALDRLAGRLKEFAEGSSDRLIDVPKFKEIAGVSRKYAIPLIEYFDREHITARVCDKRKIL